VAVASKDVGNIQIKLRRDVYKDFRRICFEKDTNMRAKVAELISEFIKKETEGLSLLEMTKEQKEARAGKATRAAVARSHALGHPTAHADEKGVYKLYPDGHREYVKLYSAPGRDIGQS
jgi:hypothetical protein